MSAISSKQSRWLDSGHARAARQRDPRVVRSRAAVVEAARTLFLVKGYSGTTMDDIATAAGIAKRTLYNNYADKSALFREIVSNAITYADEFVRGLGAEFASVNNPTELPTALHDFARRHALAIVRREVIALRRLLIGEARAFPEFAKEYFDRAPGQVISALAAEFAQLARKRLLKVNDARRAAEQFAYLIAGEPLDHAMLVGTIPPKSRIVECAREGVETFLARYAASR